MRKIGIIQARINSKRLPNKMLMDLGNFKILTWVINRVNNSKLLDEIVVAIPESKSNDVLNKFLKEKDCKVFRGSEDDVLNRFFNVAKKYKAEIIVRICADNPLVDSSQIDDLIKKYDFKRYDYAFNHLNRFNSNYADGFGAEIFKFDTLKKLNQYVSNKLDREHVTKYIWQNPTEFKIQIIKAEKQLAHPYLKFDIDTLEDYNNMNDLIARYNIDIDTSAIDIIKRTLKTKN